MPSIELDNVTVAYPVFGGRSVRRSDDESDPDVSVGGVITSSGRGRQIIALDDLSLSLGPGDRLGIVGHNGSGKSTLLRTMAGIFAPVRGEVRIKGSLGTMFSTGIGIQVNATGRENIVLSGLLNGLTRREAEARFDNIATFSELGEYLDFPVNTYSRGMAMRLAFTMATEFQPDILLLDEWLGAGDQQFRKKAEQRMQELVAQAGILVLASHRLPLIKNNCDKCLWLEHGRVRMHGDSAEVVEQFSDDIAQLKRKSAG